MAYTSSNMQIIYISGFHIYVLWRNLSLIFLESKLEVVLNIYAKMSSHKWQVIELVKIRLIANKMIRIKFLSNISRIEQILQPRLLGDKKKIQQYNNLCVKKYIKK